MNIELGEVLKKRGMRPSQLADGIGVSRGYISEIMSGKKRPSMDTIDEIVRFTGASHAELFGGKAAAARAGLSEPSAAFLPPASGKRAGRNGLKSQGAQRLKATRTHFAFAILEGDILDIDPRKVALDGGLFVVNRVDLETGEATTLVRRGFPDSLQSDDPAAAPEPWTGKNYEYAIMGKIVSISREL